MQISKRLPHQNSQSLINPYRMRRGGGAKGGENVALFSGIDLSPLCIVWEDKWRWGKYWGLIPQLSNLLIAYKFHVHFV